MCRLEKTILNMKKPLSLDDYMLIITDIQNIQTMILQDFHLFCEEHNLRYVLSWGTLLGAIRHNGFIPWDDDIDVCMPRHDYEMFLEKKSEFSNKYFVQNYNIDNSPFPFTKIRKQNTEMVMKSSESGDFNQGIWIDVFPMDQMPKNKDSLLFKIRYYRIANLIGIVTSTEISKARSAGNIINKTLRYFYYYLNKILKPNYFVNKLEYTLKKDFDNKGELFDLTNASMKDFNNLFSIKNEDLGNRKLHKFEEYEFYIPNNAEFYLNKLYGNYLQYPPKDQQFPHHKVIKLKY